MQIVAHVLKNMSPPRFSKNVLNPFSTGHMQCFLFVNAETFCPSSTRTVAVVLLLQFTSRIGSHRLFLDEESFLPCVNVIRPGLDLQCPVVTIASRSNYLEHAITNTQCSLSVHVQQTLHWFYHTKHTYRNHYAIMINFYS